MNWIVFAIIAPLFLSGYQALSKLLPKKTPVFLVSFYIYALATLFFLILHLIGSSNKSFSLSFKYAPIVIGIAAFLTIANYSIVKAYTLGAPQSSFSAIFNPLYIIFGLFLGVIIWQEKLNLYQALGVALSLIGMMLVIYFKK